MKIEEIRGHSQRLGDASHQQLEKKGRKDSPLEPSWEPQLGSAIILILDFWLSDMQEN